MQQTSGALAGWSSSVQQHARWSQAPLSRLLAGIVVFMGNLAGKVPRGVQEQLRFLSLRDFCHMQVDAEKTAAACWQRLAELAEKTSTIDARARAEIERMWQDEERHRRMFDVLTSSLEDGGGDPVEKLREVSEFFLPREHRSGELGRNPLGSGGRVHVLEGEASLDKIRALREVLERSGLGSALRAKSHDLGKPLEEFRVLVKPTFMLGYDRRHRAILTDPELVEELARFLVQLGVCEVLVGEGRNIYDAFCEHRSVHEVASYFGFQSSLHRIVDLTDDQVPHTHPRGMAQDTVARSWRDADFRISFSKLRSHPVDFTHLCLGGLQGIGARLEDFLFLERQAHRDTALLMPLTEFPPDFALIDGYDSAADGLIGIIACPNPPRPRRFYAGADALAVDLVATRHLGLENPRDSMVLDAACHWFGDPTPELSVIGPDEPVSPWRSPYHNEVTTVLSLLASPVYQLASHRGAAFLPPMDEDAFPLKSRGGWPLRLERLLLRKLLGMSSPR